MPLQDEWNYPLVARVGEIAGRPYRCRNSAIVACNALRKW